MSRIDEIKARQKERRERFYPEAGSGHSEEWKATGDIDYLLSRLKDGGAEDVRKLTLSELNHLLALLEAKKESGEFTGLRKQYYARTERLIKWCQEQIK